MVSVIYVTPHRSMSPQSKTRCLLMIIGMPRSFRRTYEDSIGKHIIAHNNHITFDIVTHTPVDNQLVHDTYAPLCNHYYHLSNDICISGGGGLDIPYLRVLECYRHVHDDAVLRHEPQPLYDIYMWVRFDVLLHGPVHLCELNDNLVCSLHPDKVAGRVRMHGDVHDRDWDYAHVGNHKAFKCMVDAISEFFVYDPSTHMYSKCPTQMDGRPLTVTWKRDAKPAYTDEEGKYIGYNKGYTDQYSVRAHIFKVLYENGLSFDFVWGETNAFLGHLVR